jgi:hypothetical protein
MTSMSVTASTPFTVHDLEGMPDDGRRYELIDGELLVSPAPGLRHQTVGLRLYRVLDDACPDDLYVLTAPFAVQTDISNEVQPDVLVARFDELTEKNLPAAPVLAVEVLSTSSAPPTSGWVPPATGCSIRTYPTCWSSSSTPGADTSKWPGWSATRASKPTGRSRCGSCRSNCSDAFITAERPVSSVRTRSDDLAPRRPIDATAARCLPSPHR